MAGRLRCLYLPGLGTGPASVKAHVLRERLAGCGVVLDTVDLRVPSFAQMRVESMIVAARVALHRVCADGDTRVLLVGTSLGGYVSLAVADDPRVVAMVLLAPLLEPAGVRRTLPWLAWGWEAMGVLPIPDKTEGRLRAVRVGLLRDFDGLPPAASPGVPTLLVHGLRDRRVDIEPARRFAARHEQVRLLTPDDGHDLYGSLEEVLGATEHLLQPWVGG